MHVCIISSQRPTSVERMERLLDGLDPWWYVPEGEGGDYAYAGAKKVQEVVSGWSEHSGGEMRPTISDQRNVALDDAGADWCVQFNDDLAVSDRFPTGLNLARPDEFHLNTIVAGFPLDTTSAEVPVTARLAIEVVQQGMAETGAHLGGCAATTNLFFIPKAKWGTAHFIMGQMMVMTPSEPLRFDRRFGSKEDYDYTLQHLTTYGVVCRANCLLGNFKHNEKRGGWANYRSLDEQRLLSVALVDAWAPHIVLNPRRDGEVLIKWKG